MKRVITKMDVAPGTLVIKEKLHVRVQFDFEDHGTEVFNVEAKRWLNLLEWAKSVSAYVSWNEIKKEIYYSIVMESSINKEIA